MKNILFVLLCLLHNLYAYGQCYDVYKNKSDCPTEEDSLVLYNNALKVVQFYDNNKEYALTNSVELETNDEKIDVFEQLKTARRYFNIIRREMANLSEAEKKFSAGKPKTGYKDISYTQYYNEVDEYRFYQRELENQIVNTNAQMPIYDYRIAPIIVNTYRNNDSTSIYFGDLVNIPLYVPVVVKPFALLTAPELMLRNKILKLPMPLIVPIRSMVKRDTLPVKNFYVKEGKIEQKNPFIYPGAYKLPVYAYNNYGSASVIGFMIGRKFKKLTHEEYAAFAVATFARNILEDDRLLDQLLKVKFGEYYTGLL